MAGWILFENRLVSYGLGGKTLATSHVTCSTDRSISISSARDSERPYIYDWLNRNLTAFVQDIYIACGILGKSDVAQTRYRRSSGGRSELQYIVSIMKLA